MTQTSNSNKSCPKNADGHVFKWTNIIDIEKEPGTKLRKWRCPCGYEEWRPDPT